MPTPTLDEATEQRRRTMLIAGVLSAVVLLIGAGVALAALAHRPAVTKPPLTPAQETTKTPAVTTTPTSSMLPTSTTPTSTASATSTTVTTITPAGQIVRSGRIAWRRGTEIWVSEQDGTNAKHVYDSADAHFSISPDGRTLVVGSGTAYALVDTTNLAQLPLSGPADLPVWAPDSSWLAYTSKSATGTLSVRRVNRTGNGDALIVAGEARPQISPDGKRVALMSSFEPNDTDALKVYDISAKNLYAVPDSKGAKTFAYGPDGVLYFARDTIGTTRGVLAMTDKTLKKTTVIAQLPAESGYPDPAALLPSPDGAKVLFAMTGDDGHSHMQVADVAGKKLKTITQPRYEATPLAWLLDSSAFLYIEGNAQVPGEATSLYRIQPDGSKRTIVVQDARLAAAS